MLCLKRINKLNFDAKRNRSICLSVSASIDFVVMRDGPSSIGLAVMVFISRYFYHFYDIKGNVNMYSERETNISVIISEI